MKIATICFPVKDNKVYLSYKKLKIGAGFLNGYGGKLESEDKSIEDSMVREISEEGNLLVSKENLEKVAIINFFEEDNYIFECHVFFLRDWEGEFRETPEMGKPEAYDLDNIPYDRMLKGDALWAPLIFSGKKIRAKLIHSEGLRDVKKFEYELLKN